MVWCEGRSQLSRSQLHRFLGAAQSSTNIRLNRPDKKEAVAGASTNPQLGSPDL